MCRGALLGSQQLGQGYCQETVGRIRTLESSLSDLAFTRSVRRTTFCNYQWPSSKEALISLASDPETGERVEYIVVEPKVEGEKLGHRFRELRMFRGLPVLHGFISTEEEEPNSIEWIEGVHQWSPISTDYYVVSGLQLESIFTLCRCLSSDSISPSMNLGGMGPSPG